MKVPVCCVINQYLLSVLVSENFWLPANYALLWTLAWVPTPYTGQCEAKLTQIQQRFQFLKFETIVSFSTTRLFTTLFLSKESTSQILKINLIRIGL